MPIGMPGHIARGLNLRNLDKRINGHLQDVRQSLKELKDGKHEDVMELLRNKKGRPQALDERMIEWMTEEWFSPHKNRWRTDVPPAVQRMKIVAEAYTHAIELALKSKEPKSVLSLHVCSGRSWEAYVIDSDVQVIVLILTPGAKDEVKQHDLDNYGPYKERDGIYVVAPDERIDDIAQDFGDTPAEDRSDNIDGMGVGRLQLQTTDKKAKSKDKTKY